jgi:diacylglycerol kinase family enzyme
MSQYFFETERRNPSITLERPGEQPDVGLATVIVQNAAPWTFLGDRAVNACPDASFDRGLDVLAMKALHVPSTTRTLQQILASRTQPHGKRVLSLHDLEAFTLRTDRQMAFQLDGEYLGERNKIEFLSVPEALRIVC